MVKNGSLTVMSIGLKLTKTFKKKYLHEFSRYKIFLKWRVAYVWCVYRNEDETWFSFSSERFDQCIGARNPSIRTEAVFSINENIDEQHICQP